MAQSVEFWYRRQYNLPPTDPRFLDATLEEIETDFWAHHFHAHPETETGEVVEDDDLDVEALAAAMESADWETVIRGNGA